MWKLMGEIINLFLNMHCDVHYYSAKFEIKIQLVYTEIKFFALWDIMDKIA